MIPESYVIERVNIAAPTSFSGNPRTHSDTQIDQIAASIREFGWTNPILIDASGTIIAGHGRLGAATRLGLDQVPVIRLGHLSDARRKALVIADNQLALNAGWDEEALSNLIRELDAETFELDFLGFESADLDRYLTGLDEEATVSDGDFAYDHEEYEEGVCAIALPVQTLSLDNYALALSMPSRRFQDRLPLLREALAQAKRAIEAAAGVT